MTAVRAKQESVTASYLDLPARVYLSALPQSHGVG